MQVSNDNSPVPSPYQGRIVFDEGRLVPYGNEMRALPKRTTVLVGVNDHDGGITFLAEVEGNKESYVQHGEGTLDAMLAALRAHYGNSLLRLQ